MTEVYAHRGCHDTEPENTIGAFLAARALGADGVEFDVRRCAEGDLVILHDPTVAGRVVAQTPLVELPEYVPTLGEALRACAGLGVNVEIKNYRHGSEPTYDETGSFARQVVTALHEAGRDGDALVSCFDLDTCRAVRAADPRMKVGWLIEARTPLAVALEAAHHAGLTAVNPNYRGVNLEGAARAHELGISLNVWTVNRERDIMAMASLSVASIITDDPATALAIVRAAPGPGPAAMA